jgi:predicted  nucleic acid-binding Zn-ribbon protein
MRGSHLYYLTLTGGIDVDEIKAYCMKCKAERVVSNVQIVTMKNGRPAANGQCPVCGTKMFKFLPKNTVVPAAKEAPAAEPVQTEAAPAAEPPSNDSM